MEKLSAFLDLFRKGKEVANPAAWKNGTITVNAVAAVLASVVGVAKVFGYDLPVSQEILDQAAVGIVAFAGAGNAVMHVITSSKVGVSTKG
jgi:hypothetical protein